LSPIDVLPQAIEPERKKDATPKDRVFINNWYIWMFGCGGRIWTCDLQVMSLTFLAENLKRIGVSPVYRHMQTLR